jgi:hypothetical protein
MFSNSFFCESCFQLLMSLRIKFHVNLWNSKYEAMHRISSHYFISVLYVCAILGTTKSSKACLNAYSYLHWKLDNCASEVSWGMKLLLHRMKLHHSLSSPCQQNAWSFSWNPIGTGLRLIGFIKTSCTLIRMTYQHFCKKNWGESQEGFI